MKKPLALIAAALTALAANAVEFEAGLGISQTHKQPNGTWYQEGFPYSLDLRKKSFYLGVRHQLTPQFSIHADYVNFGVLHSDAIATPGDSNYDAVNHSCVGACVAQSRFVGSGRSDGLKVAANWMPRPDGFGVIAGAFLFKPSWAVTVYDWKQSADQPGQTIQHSIQSKWVLRPVVGINYRIDKVDIRLEHYFNKPYSSSETGITRSTTMLSVGGVF